MIFHDFGFLIIFSKLIYKIIVVVKNNEYSSCNLIRK